MQRQLWLVVISVLFNLLVGTSDLTAEEHTISAHNFGLSVCKNSLECLRSFDLDDNNASCHRAKSVSHCIIITVESFKYVPAKFDLFASPNPTFELSEVHGFFLSDDSFLIFRFDVRLGVDAMAPLQFKTLRRQLDDFVDNEQLSALDDRFLNGDRNDAFLLAGRIINSGGNIDALLEIFDFAEAYRPNDNRFIVNSYPEIE